MQLMHSTTADIMKREEKMSEANNIDFEKLEAALKDIEEGTKQAAAILQDLKVCQSDVSKTVLTSVVKKRLSTLMPSFKTVEELCA